MGSGRWPCGRVGDDLCRRREVIVEGKRCRRSANGAVTCQPEPTTQVKAAMKIGGLKAHPTVDAPMFIPRQPPRVG